MFNRKLGRIDLMNLASAPIIDVLHKYHSPKDTAKIPDEHIIELAPLAFQRGRIYKDARDSRACSVNQTKMVHNRLGAISTIVIDDFQHPAFHFLITGE